MINIHRFKELAKRLVNTRQEIELLLKEIYLYKKGEPTSSEGHMAMIRLFMETGGISNDLISWATGEPSVKLQNRGILQDNLDFQEHSLVQRLRDKGYLIFPSLFSPDWCDKIVEYALSSPGSYRPTDEFKTINSSPCIFNRSSPEATLFSYDSVEATSNEQIQDLLADVSILALAQAYLGSLPIVDIVALWWSTAFKPIADKESAQWWHFDMDRPKWLKLFVYLTNVNKENGPHCFIEGSHSRGGIPFALRSKGYTRLEDALIYKHFDPNRITEFTAPKGTVIIEDTRGLHKGQNVISGDRLILQVEYCSSLFGAQVNQINLPKKISSALQDRMDKTPRVYRLFEKQ